MRRKHKNIIYTCIAVLCGIVMFACSNTLKEIREISDTNKPNSFGKNIDFTYTDSAKNRFRMIASEMIEKYKEKEIINREFPKGLTVYSYNKKGEQHAELIADYAIHFIDRKLWKVQKNVVAKTVDNKMLQTQEAYWDMQKEIFFTDSAFSFTDNNNVIYGIGFKSDDKFDQINMKKTTGVVYIDKTSLTTDSISSDSLHTPSTQLQSSE